MQFAPIFENALNLDAKTALHLVSYHTCISSFQYFELSGDQLVFLHIHEGRHANQIAHAILIILLVICRSAVHT